MKKQFGFTAVELILITVILAVLAAVIVPALNDSTASDYRTVAACYVVSENSYGKELTREEVPCPTACPVDGYRLCMKEESQL